MNAFRILGSFAFGLVLALPAVTALAASDAPSAPFIPEKYIISRGPAEFGQAWSSEPAAPAPAQVEKQKVLDGSAYTVVTPIFTGQDGNSSFLRFPNYEATIGTNLITVVGATSGTVYGTAIVGPQAHASPQVTIATLLSQANVTTTTNTTGEAVSLYIRNPSATAAFQHVIYNANSGFFENMSVCTYLNGTTRNYRFLNSGVFNIHTVATTPTALTNYPSYVTIHNTLNTPVATLLDVYEAVTGDLKGTYTMSALANTTYAIPFYTIQNEAGWSPTTTELHANVIARTPNKTAPALVLGQYVYNATLKTYVNMSTVCPINYANQ